MSDQFAHQLRLDQIVDGARLDLSADEDERDSIAKRLGLPSLARLDAHVVLSRSDEAIRAQGRLLAALEQSCVVTGDPVAGHVDEAFMIRFISEQPNNPDAEIELGAEDCDTVFYEGGAIDLGAALADTLALSLDPYPRSPAAAIALKDAGILTEEQAGPFAALAQLKRNDGDKA
jgi:uncharacterized metal-binding protein YceD (DUF177 family)